MKDKNNDEGSWVLIATAWKDGRKDFCLSQIHFEEAGRWDFIGIILVP